MKTVVALTLLILSQPLWAKDDVSTFHRLLVFNQDNELLIVKIKDRDFWVTPGWYQDSKQELTQGFSQFENDYNLSMSKPKLAGIFMLKNQKDTIFSIRNFYIAQTTAEKITFPEVIEKVEWLPLEQALEKITFPHIQLLIKQVSTQPGKIWGGSVKRFKVGDKYRAVLTENFYPLR